jgi:hypothetical protein
MNNFTPASVRAAPDTQVSNITSSTWAEMKKRPVWFYSLIAVPVILNILVLFVASKEADIGEAIIIPWLPFLIWRFKVARSMRTKFWQQVAKAKGWVFASDASVDDQEALFLNTGHTRRLQNVVKGVQAELPCRVFESRYTVGRGKRKTTYKFACMAFQFTGSFPHLYLNKKDNKVSFISNEKFKISLPTSFDEQFALYAPNEYELEALQVFTPDVMEYLLRVDWPYDIEFVDQEMIVFHRGYINTLQALEQELTKASELAKFFQHNLQHMSFTPINQTPHLLREVQSGRRSGWSIFKLVALVIMVLFIVIILTAVFSG